MAVKTAKVTGRRQLHFETYQDVLDDVHHLAAAPHRQLGNWSLGEICQHLAKAMRVSTDGAPGRAPWYLRMVGPLLKNRIINNPMSPGFTLPPAMAGTFLPDCAETEAGVSELEQAVARMNDASGRHPHPVFGTLSREEWDKLHMRHCEMHLSFIVPE